MKYAVEIDSDAMTHIRSLTKIGSGIQKLTERNHRHTGSNSKLISLFIFFFKITKVS
jgi:hypothetical protein